MSIAVQIIDDTGKFVELTDTNFPSISGTDFSVLSILGCQSGGKSTLLNSLFQTKFATMDCTKGRGQTTKGIWLSSHEESKTLIIDVEGTDSKERGEDRHTFEHRASLFSLAISDIVLLNLWYHDIGRYAASNYGLLQTIFEANLDLFGRTQRSGKTILYFVIRDWNQQLTPMDLLMKLLHADINTIWSGIQKRPEYANVTADDYFVFHYLAMPSFITQPDEFESQITVLKEELNHTLRPPAYTHNIPIDGFGVYASGIWSAIMGSEQLDIPNQKLMVSIYRCEVLQATAFKEFELPSEWDIELIRERAKSVMSTFESSASRYDTNIFQDHAQKLASSMVSLCTTAFSTYWETQSRELLESHKERLLPLLTEFSDERLQLESMARICDTWISEVTIEASKDLDQAWLMLGGNFYLLTLDNELEKYRCELKNHKSELINKGKVRFIELVSTTLEDAFTIIKKEAASGKLESFWSDVSFAIENLIIAHSTVNHAIANSLWCDANDPRKALQQAYTEAIPAYYKSHIDLMSNVFYDRFILHFEFDDTGLPVRMEDLSSDEIKSAFTRSQAEARRLVKCLQTACFDFKSLGDEDTAVVEIPHDKMEHLWALASTLMTSCGQKAQIIQANAATRTHIPPFMWLLVLALGWNEIWYVIKSPFAAIFITFFLIGLGCLFATGNMAVLVNIARSVMVGFATKILAQQK